MGPSIGEEHSDSSVKLFHMDELSEEAKEKAMKGKGKKKYDFKEMRKSAASKAMKKKKKSESGY